MAIIHAAATTVAADNSYAALFLDYINQSLAESLTSVRAVESRLPEEERVQACHILDFGLRSAESWASAKALTIDLATYMERSGQWESWQQILERAIATAQRLRDTDHEITLTALLARLYQRWSKPAVMVQSYRRVIRLARRNGNRYELARACSNLGYHYILAGNLWRAELLNYHALAIFNELESNHGRAHTHNHLGILFTRQYDWVKAEEHLLAACAIWQASHDHFGLMRGYGNLGFLYLETTNYNAAIEYSTLALKLAETLGEEPLIGNFASNISFSQLKLEDVPKAKQFADLAEMIFKRYADHSGLARLSHTKGLIAIHENNYAQAQDCLSYALNTLEEHYFLIQVKFTKIKLEIRLYNYTVAKQELAEVETWINKHPASSAMQLFTGKLDEYRRCLEQVSTLRIA